MISHTSKRFRDAFEQLPDEIQKKAREAYRMWKKDPWDKRVRFKQVHRTKPIYSVRIGLGWRALGVKSGNDMIWFWIGSHADYDILLSQM